LVEDDNRANDHDLPEPSILAQSIINEIEAAMDEMRLLLIDLGEEEEA